MGQQAAICAVQFHKHADLGAQDFGHKRLGEIVHRSQRVTAPDVIFAASQRGEKDDRRVARALAFADQSGGFEAVHLRHHHIQHDHGEILIEQVAQGFAARFGRDHFLTERFQHGPGGEKIISLIVHQQNLHGTRRLGARSCPEISLARSCGEPASYGHARSNWPLFVDRRSCVQTRISEKSWSRSTGLAM